MNWIRARKPGPGGKVVAFMNQDPFHTRRTLALLFLTVFIDIMGFGILIPVIPILLADPASPFFLLPAGMSVQTGYVLLGCLTATFPLMQFIAAPMLGQLSDRYGRRKVLALSLAGTSLSYFLFAYAIVIRNIPLLFISRALDGATGGVVAVTHASVADLTDPEHRVRRFALLAAAFGLGFVGGPFLGGKLSDPAVVGWFTAATPFWFSGLLALANTVSVIVFMPETLAAPSGPERLRWGQSWRNIVQAFSHPTLRALFLTMFLYISGFSFYANFASVFMIHRFGFDQGDIGDYFAFLGAVGLFTQYFVVRRVARHWPAHRVLAYAPGLAGLLMLLASWQSAWWGFVGVMFFFAVCSNLIQTNSTGLVSASADPGVQGRVMGLSSSVQALAMTAPPIFSGLLAAVFSPEAPIRFSSVLILAAAGTFLIFYRTPPAVRA